MSRLTAFALLIGRLAAHGALRRPRPLSLADRLAAFPRDGWPVEKPVRIFWNDRQVPFIDAGTDADLAVALGGVHAHLRLAQIEMARRISQGRLAETVGEIGLGIDRMVRTLDPGRAVPKIIEALPAETRAWLDGFARGISHYQAKVAKLPLEFSMLGLAPAPWTIADLLTFGRLAGVDISWMVWFRLLGLKRGPDWPKLWRRILDADLGSGGTSAFADGAAADSVFAATLRSGSNSLAVSAWRSASGGALIASDPHLSLMQPGPWLIAGFGSPSYHAVGLMFPGLPFVALGRNEGIGWGGTNLHATSSELVALPAEARGGLRERVETIRVRWSRPRRQRVRESAHGPVVSDLPGATAAGRDLALRWVGHMPSDESTAMLRLLRARDWEDFVGAVDSFAVPAQRMLYADAQGRIGTALAARFPRWRRDPPAEIWTAPAEMADWGALLSARTLPSAFDPESGFIASANERPRPESAIVGHYFAPPDRKLRIDALLGGLPKAEVADLMRILRDVRWRPAEEMRANLLSWLDADTAAARGKREEELVAALRVWNCDYAADSRGALAFELISCGLARAMISAERRAALSIAWGTRRLLWEEIVAADSDARRAALRRALREAARAAPPAGGWGTIHRLRLGHPLSRFPLLGRAAPGRDLPGAGSSETLLKTAHPLTDRRHAASYGSSARHVSDLADLDRNYFALPGGQDGWIGSANFGDQTEAWTRGEFVAVPMRIETVAAQFPHRIELLP